MGSDISPIWAQRKPQHLLPRAFQIDPGTHFFGFDVRTPWEIYDLGPLWGPLWALFGKLEIAVWRAGTGWLARKFGTVKGPAVGPTRKAGGWLAVWWAGTGWSHPRGPHKDNN